MTTINMTTINMTTIQRTLLCLTWFLLSALGETAAQTPAAPKSVDLKKVDRTIAKEPKYTTAQPAYCLLVFGPTATTRVWLVADGDVLFVDRNGNGDLTEPGESVRFTVFGEGYGPYSASRQAEAGGIVEGKLKHEGLTVTQYRVNAAHVPVSFWEEQLLLLTKATAKGADALTCSLRINLEIRPRPGDPIRIAGRVDQYAGMDGAGFLQFAKSPADAPIVHLRGPLQLGLYSPQRLVLGSEPSELTALVGTPGLGNGAFASIPYGGLIADTAKPAVEIEFPSDSLANPTPRERCVLPHRC